MRLSTLANGVSIESHEPKGPMYKLSRNHFTVAASVVAAAVGGTAIADAASSSSSSSATAAQDRPLDGSGEKALTGTTAAKVKAAALAKVPGTVLRVETDRGGVYEAHVRQADGTEAEVAVGKDFKVTAVREGGPGGRSGRGDRGDRAAALAKALGVETSAVQKVLDANRPARPADGARPSQADLIAALAKGLSLDEAKVQKAVEATEAAHRAEHEARHTAMYAAVAKALGKTTAEVKAAFEAARPAMPTP